MTVQPPVNKCTNWVRLEILLGRTNSHLQKLFKDRYQRLFSSSYTDTPTSGSFLYSNVVQNNRTKLNLTKVQKDLVQNGNSNDWDITTLVALILATANSLTLNKNDQLQVDIENKNVISLRNIRNLLAHHATKYIPDSEYEQLWEQLKSILLFFRENESDIDKLKDDIEFKSDEMKDVDQENTKEALRLKELGNTAFKEGRLDEAIQHFTKAIVLPSLPPRDLAILHSNRSAAYLGLYERNKNEERYVFQMETNDERYQSLLDAKKSRNLWVAWSKAHFRVGKSYSSLNEHEKAINSFERALALNPSNKDIRDALDDSRTIFNRQVRHERKLLVDNLC